MPTRPPLVLIAGPTASGKSALALALAERTGGVIINADSAQIYRDIPILSAAPSKADRASADHRLYSERDGALACSAADFAELAGAQIVSVHAGGKLPILVGGTGLYIRALLDGIAPVPPIDCGIRRDVRSAAVEDNYAQLRNRDPVAAARLHQSDTTRIARALEVVLSTGQALADWQHQRTGGIGASVTIRPLIILPPRDKLYQRCDARFVEIWGMGALAEVERLLARNLDPRVPVMRAIGVSQIAAFLRGDLSRDDSIVAGQQATRNYAKRQYTWFAHQSPVEWPRFTQSLDVGLSTALESLALRD
jgi:tRNA dimethylallyltransferase